VLVIGSGAAGLTAALTAAAHGLEVVVAEKEPLLGGTTALSEGMVWVPVSSHARRAGVADSLDAALDYLRAAAGNHFDRGRAEAYVATAAEMLDFVESVSPVRYVLVPGSIDYHQELPGASAGARALRPGLFDGRRLGPRFAALRPPLASTMVLGGMTIASADLPHFLAMSRSARSLLHIAKVAGRHAVDRLVRRHPRGTRIAGRNGLAAALLRALLDRGVPVWAEARATGLTTRRDGRVTGAVIERRGGRAVTVTARRGVVLASGGFPGDEALRRRYYAHVAAGQGHHSLVPDTNRGDGLRLALGVGGVMDEGVAQPAAWTPVSLVPVEGHGRPVPFPHYIDRGKPGVIAVDRRGRRFCDEACTYHAFVPAMVEACRGDPEVEAWLVADHRAIRRHGLGAVPTYPGRLGPHLRSGYLARGATPRELARRLGIDPDGLAATVEGFNRHAAKGEDPEFGKGGSAYDRANGDPAHGPNPCLAPLLGPPFYAVRLVPGDIANFVGVPTDREARVLDGEGRPVVGLYAAGNDATSAMAGSTRRPGSRSGRR
jgi:succinate dehydrogenase/fumarate reductase flavoprotein subunit